MKKYLSIGQVSKLKGVSIKSLRYYGELGILPPAYINKKTGYRYYTMEQMVVLDLIVTCIDLDIPLKNFHQYFLDSEHLNMEKIVCDGQTIANKKIHDLKKTLLAINNISAHLATTEEIKKRTGFYIQKIPKRFFLTVKWSGNIYNSGEFIRKLSQLYKECDELDMNLKYNQGVMLLYENGTIENRVFIEISDFKGDVPNILIVPEGDFICQVYSNENLPLGEHKYLKDKMYPNGSIFIARELYDKKIDYQPTPIEIQLLVKK